MGFNVYKCKAEAEKYPAIYGSCFVGEITCTLCGKEYYTWDDDVIMNQATQCDCPYCHPDEEHCFHITERRVSKYFEDDYWMEAMCCICGQKISGLDRDKYPFYVFYFTSDLNENSETTLYMIDFSKNTGEYKPGTIGEMNGFNHPQIPISNNLTIKEMILMFYPKLCI